MVKQLKGLLYFFITDIRYNFIIFWSILLSTMSVSLIAAYLLIQVGETKMIFVLSAAIYIFCGFIGFFTAKGQIPFAIKIGATRKNLFISLGVFFLGLSIVKAILSNTVQLIMEKIFHVKTIVFMHPAQLLTDSWMTRITVDAMVMFCILAFTLLLGLLFYKYGLLGGGSVVGIVVIVLLLGTAQGWLIDFLVDTFQSMSIAFFYQILLMGIIFYGISWILLRKIAIVNIK